MLTLDSDPHQPGLRCVGVHNLDPHLITPLGGCAQARHLLQSILRVRVIGTGFQKGENLPDVYGRHQVLQNEIRFIPHFPFEPGVRYRASFDPRPLGHTDLAEVMIHEFSLPRELNAEPTQVEQVFPSGDSLPENMLRFYVCFSNSMQRGRVEKHIRLLDADGRPAPDVLYRPPVELWDRSMRHLTILLDPGRIKRGVGPNRELGPPLKAGQDYTLAIGPEMVDLSGCPLHEGFYKHFNVTEAVREPISVEQWKIALPGTKSRQRLALMFPRPLDWALLWRKITIESEDGRPVDGRVAIEQGEKRWSFTPTSPWNEGSYCVRVKSNLEDICGNSLLGTFDRPFRSTGDLVNEASNSSIPFQLA